MKFFMTDNRYRNSASEEHVARSIVDVSAELERVKAENARLRGELRYIEAFWDGTEKRDHMLLALERITQTASKALEARP